MAPIPMLSWASKASNLVLTNFRLISSAYLAALSISLALSLSLRRLTMGPIELKYVMIIFRSNLEKHLN
jgi:hypothetical protein